METLVGAVVLSVTRLADEEREVFDLETEHGTFCTASGLVLKNTDSIYCMFDVGIDKASPAYMPAVFEVAARAAKDVSTLFKRPIELEFEKVMKPFVLLSKKRYAYVPYSEPNTPGEMEAKGLAMVRRDSCPYARSVLRGTISALLERSVEASVAVAREGVRVLLAGLAPTAELTLSKSLRDAYKSNPPHVALAGRMRARCAESAPRPGDRVAYVIVEGPKNAKLGDVIEDPAYVAEKGLRIDYIAYYERQLKTPLLELFDVCGARGALDATVTVARSVDKQRKDVIGFCRLFGQATSPKRVNHPKDPKE
jgi:DNA polymerase delta subunit 1